MAVGERDQAEFYKDSAGIYSQGAGGQGKCVDGKLSRRTGGDPLLKAGLGPRRQSREAAAEGLGICQGLGNPAPPAKAITGFSLGLGSKAEGLP